jgi:predicted RNase H-like HicB family nuclease
MRVAFDPACPRCPVPTVGRILGARAPPGSEKSEMARSDFGARDDARAGYRRGNRNSSIAAMNASPPVPRYRVALHHVKGCYVARVLDIPGCMSRGASEVEAVENARVAIRAYLGIAHALAGDRAVVELEIAA